MYGLPQSGLLANELFEKRLNKRGQSEPPPPCNEHQITSTTIQCTTTFTSTRLCGGSHEKALASTWFGPPLTMQFTQLENEVHQAMAVMDADTGKLLNYRQLMRSTKYREAWSFSSANKFGRLGISGRKKIPPTLLRLYSNTTYQQNLGC